MKAIILAAGVSRRLYPLTHDTPKCLLEVGGRPIIDFQMEALKKQEYQKRLLLWVIFVRN
jgi:NDP-sugar pyrophosphorylase family protein